MAPAGARVVGIMGGPQQVAASFSPRIHNAAFKALGMDWVYVGFPAESGSAPRTARALAASGVAGFNVTMPHKTAVAGAVDRLEGPAKATQAVNTVEVRDGELIGWNTDGEGLVRFLRVDAGATIEGASAAVLGSGGAARACVAALAEAGARSITVLARNEARAEALRALAAGTDFRCGPLGPESSRILESSDLVINATPLGRAGDPAAAAAEHVRAGATVVDLVYVPPAGHLVEAARARGASAHGGLGMLVHQAALAFAIWSGVEPPLDVMREAARDALREASG